MSEFGDMQRIVLVEAYQPRIFRVRRPLDEVIRDWGMRLVGRPVHAPASVKRAVLYGTQPNAHDEIAVITCTADRGDRNDAVRQWHCGYAPAELLPADVSDPAATELDVLAMGADALSTDFRSAVLGSLVLLEGMEAIDHYGLQNIRRGL